MNRRSTVLAVISVIGTLLTLPAVAADKALEKIMANKTIRVAVPQDYPPYGFVDRDMKPKGYDIDMANLIANKLGVRLELIPVTGPNRVAFLQTGKADLTISSLGKTPERAKVIDFSIAYAPFFDAIFGSKEVQAKNFEELSGKTISVTRGSMQDEALQRVAPNAIIKRFEDNNATLSAFLSGQTQMFATGTTVAAAIQQRDPNLSLELKVILANSPCYVGVPKGEAQLLAKVNQIILDAKKTGVLDEISQRWLGAPAGDLPE
jgi:polar amino acid transport system substrate-binding protein